MTPIFSLDLIMKSYPTTCPYKTRLPIIFTSMSFWPHQPIIAFFHFSPFYVAFSRSYLFPLSKSFCSLFPLYLFSISKGQLSPVIAPGGQAPSQTYKLSSKLHALTHSLSQAWKDLPINIHEANSLLSFKSLLEIFLSHDVYTNLVGWLDYWVYWVHCLPCWPTVSVLLCTTLSACIHEFFISYI